MNKHLFARYRYSAILLRELVVTDFKLRYQGSVLGYLWALLRPLFMFAIIYVIFAVVLGIGKDIQHWPVALLLGLVMWNFFTEITKQGLTSVVASSGILSKINFPKYVIPFAVSISALINLIINLIIVGVFMIINGVELSWHILLVPVFILQMYAFALGVALILGTVYVKYRDVSHIWDIIIQAFFYGSAIMFPITRAVEMSPIVAQLLLLNPAAQSINEARILLATPDLPTLYSLSNSIWVVLIPYVLTILVLVFGAWYFRRNSPKFAEEV